MFSVVNKNTKILKSLESQIEEYNSLLKAVGTPLKTSPQELINIVSETLQQGKLKRADISDYCRYHSGRLMVLSPNTKKIGVEKLNFLLNTVESAGVTIFLALTGWRASEYGFPLSCIKLSLNIEPKDNAYTPFRFHVKWMVPKTSGKTKLDREITLSSYFIAQKLHHMNNSNISAPCLYDTKNVRNREGDACVSILKNRVLKAWPKFVLEYELFKDLDLKGGSLALNALSKSELESLKIIRHDLRKSLPQFNFMYSKENGNDTTGKKLKAYRKGNLNQLESKVIEKNLSEGTLNKLKGELEFTRATVNAISAELRNELVYPTPHAFRHMWAEAVLLRYRGDVGKFIRANFKHIDERFFVAYLRNKETKMIVEIAKRSVINKIVRQQILAVKDKDTAYAGGFNRFITKAVSLTHVFTYKEYIKKAETIAEQRIVDIKTNAWATCMLRIGTFNMAKCSIDGVPQRFNSSPKLCLGCTNANIAEGNYNGIVVYTQQEVKALRNPNLPYFIKKDYIPTVQLALKRVKELHENKNKAKYLKFIQHLEESIQMTEKSKKEMAHD